MVVVCDEDHMVGVDSSERGQAVANNGEEGNENTVDDVNDVELSAADIDPTDQEKHPGQTEEGD